MLVILVQLNQHYILELFHYIGMTLTINKEKIRKFTFTNIFDSSRNRKWTIDRCEVKGQLHMLPFCAENGGRARPVSKLASESYESWQWCQDSIRGKAWIPLSAVKFWTNFEVCNTDILQVNGGIKWENEHILPTWQTCDPFVFSIDKISAHGPSLLIEGFISDVSFVVTFKKNPDY